MSAMDDEIAAYAAAVRAELADVPEPDRDGLLADLEEHLAEVAAESGLWEPSPGLGEERPSGAAGEPPGARLTARLGTPAAYAAELRAAYGMDAPRKRGLSFDSLFPTAVLTPSGREMAARAVESLAEFRPTWWLARGYALAAVLWRLEHDQWSVLPGNIVDVLLLALAVSGSVALGRRIRDREAAAEARSDGPLEEAGTAGAGKAGRRRSLRTLLIAGNVAAVIGLLVLPSIAGVNDPAAVSPAAEDYPNVTYGQDGNGTDLSRVVNIYPYSSDGKPMGGVLLYDQNGSPITLSPENEGLAIDRPCGGPPAIANSYPLRLTEVDPMVEDPAAVPGPASSCAPATPSPAPHPSVSSTARPQESPSARPSASPSATE